MSKYTDDDILPHDGEIHFGESIEIVPAHGRMSASRGRTGNPYGLSDRQLRIAKETGADLQTFARLLRHHARAK